MYLPNYSNNQTVPQGTMMSQPMMKKKKDDEWGWRQYLPQLISGFGGGGLMGGGMGLLGSFLAHKWGKKKDDA